MHNFLDIHIGTVRRRINGTSRRTPCRKISDMWNILNNWKRTIVEEFRRSKKIDKADFKKFKDAEKRLIKVIEWEESAWENSLIDKAEKKGLNGIWHFLNAGR